MRLEDKAILAKRQQLLHGTARTLRDAWAADVKGGTEHVEFHEMLMRDVLAYALLRYIE